MRKRPNLFQALADKVPTKNGTRTQRGTSTYPEVPAMHPNRAVRRAVGRRKYCRLPASWAAVLAPILGVPIRPMA